MKVTVQRKQQNSSISKGKILQVLRADIVSQRLKPGQAIREEELAQAYGISRTPIREILHKLEQEDLVRIIPNRGVFVSELTPRDIEEVLDLRMSLETTAARTAATKLTAKEIAELKDIDRQLTTAAQRQDSVLSFEADERLHNLIWVVAGNMRAYKIITNLMGQIRRIRFISGHKPGRIETTVKEHKEIVKALLSANPDKAEEAMRVHLLNTKQLINPPLDIEKKFEEFVRGTL